MIPSPSRLAPLLLLPLLLTGCVNVQPWERGYLARPEMALDPDPAEARLMRHAYQSKEASGGGYGVGGGGCGCN